MILKLTKKETEALDYALSFVKDEFACQLEDAIETAEYIRGFNLNGDNRTPQDQKVINERRSEYKAVNRIINKLRGAI